MQNVAVGQEMAVKAPPPGTLTDWVDQVTPAVAAGPAGAATAAARPLATNPAAARAPTSHRHAGLRMRSLSLTG
jgi:hypothetical protein